MAAYEQYGANGGLITIQWTEVRLSSGDLPFGNNLQNVNVTVRAVKRGEGYAVTGPASDPVLIPRNAN